MQEVLRLKRVSTNILSAYHDDPNIAISLMNSAFEKCKKEHQEQISVTKALQEAFKSLPTTSTSQSVTKPLPGFQTAKIVKDDVPRDKNGNEVF
jgi:hypothetical protein